MGKRWLTVTAVVLVGGALGVAAVFATHGNPNVASSAAPMVPAHKQLWHCGMHPQVIREEPGECPICHMALTPISSNDASANQSAERKILYWWDPMLGPSSISGHPGKSAMGMDLVPVYGDSGGPAVRIDPAIVQNMGVRTAKVTRGTLTKTVRTVGLLSLPEPGLHDVSLKVGGWIDKLYADQDGMHVNQGEPLFEVYSPELQVASQELIAAVKAEKSLDRAAGAEVRDEARRMVESARRKLRLWDVAETDIDAIFTASEPPRDIPFRSPATGHVEEKMIVQGSGVQPGMKLLRVADHKKMWVDAEVYEEQLPFVKMGQKVLATVDGISGKTFAGTITFMYPHLDHMTRTLKVRATLDNPEFELKPGMYATADIVTQPVNDAILCPREAVIDTGTRQIAFVAEGNGHFSPRKVRVGLSGDDDQVQIDQGLAPGETVVTSGQFLMDVESRTIEAAQKLSEGAMANAGPPDAASPPAERTSPGEMQSGLMPTVPAAPSTRPMATQPPEPSGPLVRVYCPMAKADWLQVGTAVHNPFMGTQMSDCGEVREQVAVPSADSALAPLVKAYLDIERGMNADKLDPSAVTSLNAAADRLPPDHDADLKAAAAKVAGAKDLMSARDAFKGLTIDLLKTLRRAAK